MYFLDFSGSNKVSGPARPFEIRPFLASISTFLTQNCNFIPFIGFYGFFKCENSIFQPEFALERRHNKKLQNSIFSSFYYGPGGLPPGASRRFPLVVLAVPGEVQIKRFRTGRGKQAGALTPVGSKRLAVLDLHGVDCFLRIVEGITELDGLPGFIPQGAQRTFRVLPESLCDWWPELSSVGGRTFQPVRTARIPEGAQPGEMVTATGWPAWEEHTRTCRILFDLPDLPFLD